MCTLVCLLRPDHAWPVLIAANRDELHTRACRPPARHWPGHPGVTAGLDCEAGGTWLGINDRGLIAAVLNRTGTLGPQAGKRSRGGLVLEALDQADTQTAAGTLAGLDPAAYRPFNLVVADRRHAYWLRHGGDGAVQVHAIAPGLHLLSATELDDPDHPRIRLNRPRFLAAPAPRPEANDWTAWRGLLAGTDYPDDLGPEAAMVQDRPDGFATCSSALIALPADAGPNARPCWLHAEGRPDHAAFVPLALRPDR